MRKLKIFLGDLEHTWEKVNIWTFPLNVGYVAAYALDRFPDQVEVRLFKRPELMTAAIEAEQPDIVGVTYYVWNTNLANHVLRFARAHVPGVLTVGGGPYFTSLNANAPTARKFFSGAGDQCDAFVVNQGERGFAELLGAYLDCGAEREALRTKTVPGCLVNDLARADSVQVGEPLDAIADLDEIPSPYLTGLLDEFFDGPFAPVIETNRSCPYRCTFCAWGIGTQKLARYSDARLHAEIEYIGKRCRNAGILYIADANYGVLERDAQVSEWLYQSSVKYGYPANVIASWNKTRPDRVLNTARNLRGLGRIGASMQSLHGPTLDAIKRKNLPLETVASMVEELQENEMSLFSELVLGLPLETWQTHIDANKRLMDLGAEMFNYNLHLLPGTELDGAEHRAQYVRNTGWRLYDGGYGIYDGERVFEGEEVVLETTTMSMPELRSFRFIHFLIQLMWSKEWYRDLLMLFKQAGMHPVDVMVETANALNEAEGPLGDTARRFHADHALECFDSFDELREFWSRDESFARLRSGDYGKLNYVYTQIILLEQHEAFDRFLLDVVAGGLVSRLGVADEAAFLRQCAEVLRFARVRRVELRVDAEITPRKREDFDFDILAWKRGQYASGLPTRTNGPFGYEFYLPETEQQFLRTQIEQFRSGNANMTARKVSEGISPDRLLYRVRAASAG